MPVTEPSFEPLLARKADHSPTSTAEVKIGFSRTSTPLHSFMTWCFNKGMRNMSSKRHKQFLFVYEVLQ